MQVQTNFTPGPWESIEVEEGLFHIHSPKGERHNPVPVAVLDHHRDGHEPTRTVITPANARLIAAAPELYAALKGLLADIEDYQTINNLGGSNNATQVAARAAIAKAVRS